MQAERLGHPFLVYRDEAGEQQILPLGAVDRATVGRGPEVDVRLDPDPEVSRLHAELERLAGAWVLTDDGLSQNGSYLNGERVSGRRRLRDGDLLRARTPLDDVDSSPPRMSLGCPSLYRPQGLTA